MTFGEHAGKPLREVPAAWLVWWHKQNKHRTDDLLVQYIEKTLNPNNDTMNLTPEEREEILINYSKSCIDSMRETPDFDSRWINANYDKAVMNGRDDTIKAIRDGHDTWKRIAEVAAKYTKSQP